MAKGRELEDLLGGEPEAEDAGFFGEEPQASKSTPPEKNPTPQAIVDAAEELNDAAPARDGYVVLARKYRPQTFDEIVGQENVQRALRGAIATGQISHSYLFSGPRGTGKTSTARILAKAVNCQNGGPRPDPCGHCASCQAITVGSSLDVIEIDAASNTGVDNIRDLRSGVVLAPFSRFKVYIVDEVHMLSTQAFNALLKTLEEPPSQVIFILATTELHKVPETIVSRCQTFLFRRFSTQELKSQLDMILQKELKSRALTVTDEDRGKILDLVARNAEGGMRDAQVALDQVLVFAQGSLDFESVRKFLGLAENDALDAFLREMYARNIDGLLVMIDQFASSGQDLELFVKSVCEHIRDLLIVRTAPGRSELVNVSEDRYALLRSLADELPPAFLMNVATGFLRLSEEMKTAAHPRFLLELAVMRLGVVDAVDDVQQILQRLEAVERALGGGTPPGGGGQVAAKTSAVSNTAAPQVQKSAPPKSTRAEAEETSVPERPANLEAARVQEVREAPAAPVAASKAPRTDGSSCSANELLTYLQQRTEGSSMLHITLLDCTRIQYFDGKTAVLSVDSRDKFGFTHLNRPQNMALIKQFAQELCGQEINFRVETADFGASAGERSEIAAAPVAFSVAEASIVQMRPSMPVAPTTPNVEPVSSSASVVAGEEIEPAQTIYMSPELREKAVREIKGEAFRKFLENQPDLRELVQNVKDVFKIEDSSFSFRAKSF
ncbi:MAG: DNA polymerase III subunit gamma/tau [Candidatus Sumerlaeaceae bacterium]